MNPFILYFIYLGIGLIAAIAALVLYRRVLPDYRPMLIFIWVLVAGELILAFTEGTILFDIMNQAHYVFEALMVIWIAKRWHLFDKKPVMLPLLVGFVAACWIVQELVTPNLGDLSWCRITCFMMIALIGIEMMSRTLLSTPASLSKNTIYLFSLGLILYYSLSAVGETYLFILRRNPTESMLMVYLYFGVALGTITYILYIRSILCTPTKSIYSIS